MANLIVIELSAGEYRELVWGQAYGSTPTYRNRCAMVLLKAQGYSNAKIAGQVDVSEFTVTEWIKRYRRDKMAGLQTRSGRGGKAILQESDLEAVRAVVSQHRQRLSVATAQLEVELGKRFCQKTLERFIKKTGPDTSVFDASPARVPQGDYYALKVAQLSVFENLSERGWMDIYYGDEAAICTTGNVCCGWQWSDEEVFLPAQRGARLSCFALLTRANVCRFATTTGTIDAAFVARQLESLSREIDKPTLVVLDNARLHKGTLIQSFREAWESRGLFVFYLPVYSPHLNIVEILWKHLKYFWLCAEDYLDWQNLFYQVRQALAAVGSLLHIHFKPFNYLQLIPV